MDEANAVLTLDEVAAFLRTKPIHVRHLLESGNLAGFKIAGEWRILTAAVVDFLRRKMETTQQEALSRSLTDPRVWAHELQRMPELIASLDGEEFEEGTIGAYLIRALRVVKEESKADNVVPFKPKRE